MKQLPLLSKIYSCLVDDSSEHKKARAINKIQSEYKDFFLNKKCLRHLMNIIQSKDHKGRTCEVNKISLSCFDDKTYIQNNGYDGLAFGYQNQLYKTQLSR